MHAAHVQEVLVVDNVVVEMEAGAQAFSFWNGDNPAAIYSEESRAVWDWGNKQEVPAKPSSSRPNIFLLDGSILDGLRAA